MDKNYGSGVWEEPLCPRAWIKWGRKLYDLEDCRLVLGRGITKSKYNVSIAAMCFTTNHHLTKKVNVNVDYYIVTKREISCEHDLAKC